MKSSLQSHARFLRSVLTSSISLFNFCPITTCLLSFLNHPSLVAQPSHTHSASLNTRPHSHPSYIFYPLNYSSALYLCIMPNMKLALVATSEAFSVCAFDNKRNNKYCIPTIHKSCSIEKRSESNANLIKSTWKWIILQIEEANGKCNNLII